MRKTLILAAVVSLVPFAAHAGERSRAPIYVGGGGGGGGGGGSAKANASATGVGIGSASVRNRVSSSNVNRNYNSNRQQQHQDQMATATANNRGNHQNVTFRDRLQAPALSASFSSVAGNPCERAPLGLGLSVAGFGGLFQGPMESDRCWGERQALILHSMGYTNAAIAVLAGNPVGQAVQNNPLYQPRQRVLRRKN